ncbi:hypothetical protein VFPPC_18288 [Pochonia chlamydosporia 170]|uniref:Uncharacterized protein n=1 Tax=Pochonia chlamydosporia 170 TaxID=1380566 RepID=A0A219APM4_METCM|nr:hypothetical protein VFPPC_18288 [Pochonia chlamydosporia 170]OWT42549.1 hypothetical protein VFPPC_18288 [Pochonia chlamydosporia 170]
MLWSAPVHSRQTKHGWPFSQNAVFRFPDTAPMVRRQYRGPRAEVLGARGYGYLGALLSFPAEPGRRLISGVSSCSPRPSYENSLVALYYCRFIIFSIRSRPLQR